MPTEEELLRVLISLQDFQLSLSALTFLSEEYPEKATKVELRRIRCFETTMVVSYSRPFSKSEGRLPKFKFEQVGFTPSIEEEALHTELRNLRNKRFAHSDIKTMRMHSTTFDVSGFNFPHLTFDEKLHFTNKQVAEIEVYLRRLRSKLAEWVYDVAQSDPSLLQQSINVGAGDGWPPG